MLITPNLKCPFEKKKKKIIIINEKYIYISEVLLNVIHLVRILQTEKPNSG